MLGWRFARIAGWRRFACRIHPSAHRMLGNPKVVAVEVLRASANATLHYGRRLRHRFTSGIAGGCIDTKGIVEEKRRVVLPDFVSPKYNVANHGA